MQTAWIVFVVFCCDSVQINVIAVWLELAFVNGYCTCEIRKTDGKHYYNEMVNNENLIYRTN